MGLSIHFYVDSDELHQILHNGFLDLVGQGQIPPIQPHVILPIQSHPSITWVPVPSHISMHP